MMYEIDNRLNKEEMVTFGDIEPGTYFKWCGIEYLRIVPKPIKWLESPHYAVNLSSGELEWFESCDEVEVL